MIKRSGTERYILPSKEPWHGNERETFSATSPPFFSNTRQIGYYFYGLRNRLCMHGISVGNGALPGRGYTEAHLIVRGGVD
jgi:hypothetical protein